MFLRGLSEMIKDELAAWEMPMDLDSFIALTIRIDGQGYVALARPQFPPRLRGISEVPEVNPMSPEFSRE
jgi:hypothetical protein